VCGPELPLQYEPVPVLKRSKVLTEWQLVTSSHTAMATKGSPDHCDNWRPSEPKTRNGWRSHDVLPPETSKTGDGCQTITSSMWRAQSDTGYNLQAAKRSSLYNKTQKHNMDHIVLPSLVL